MRLIALLASLMLLLAGCVGQEPEVEAASADDPPPVEEPAPETNATPTPPVKAPPVNQTTETNATPPTNATPENGTKEPAPPAPAPRVVTTSWTGSYTGAGAGAAGTPAGDVCCVGASAAGENVEGSFEVASALAGIVVELVWADGTQDLDLELMAPDHAMPMPPTGPELRTGHWWYAGGGTPAAGDAHATIAITDAEALALTGAWSWSVVPKGPANDVAFQVYVTLFYDEAPSGGFSAVPPS